MKLPHTLLRDKCDDLFLLPHKSGFTLVEVLVVLGLLLLLVGLGGLGSMEAYRSYVFTAETHTLVSVLERARSQALVNKQQLPHGVCYQAPHYILFQGTECVDTPSSERIRTARSIADASDFDTMFPVVIFTPLTATTVSATIHVTDGLRTTDIVINDEGAIFW